MEQENKNQDENHGCLTSFDIFKSAIFILCLLGYWAYYGDWDKAYKKFTKELADIATAYTWILGVIVAFVVLIILSIIISSIFDKKKDKD